MSFSVRVMQSIRVLELKIEHEDLRDYSSWKNLGGKKEEQVQEISLPSTRSKSEK